MNSNETDHNIIIPLTIGNSCNISNTENDNVKGSSNQYVTMQYTFKPSSTNEQNGQIIMNSTGVVDLIYSNSNSNSNSGMNGTGQEERHTLEGENEATNPSNPSRVVLHGSSNEVKNENYVDCILFIEESNTTDTSTTSSTASSSNNISVRLERVTASVSGLKHVRDEKNFQYESSQLSKSRRQLSNKTGLKKTTPNANTNAKKASNVGKTKTGNSIVIEKVLGDGRNDETTIITSNFTSTVGAVDGSVESVANVLVPKPKPKPKGRKKKVVPSNPDPSTDSNPITTTHTIAMDTGTGADTGVGAKRKR